MIALTLTESSLAENLELVQQAGDAIDLIELRADFLPSTFLQERKAQSQMQEFLLFLKERSLKAIFTLRRPFDGGQFQGGEEEALRWYQKAVEWGFDWIDLDESLFHDAVFVSSIQQWKKSDSLQIIRSRHDFGGIPADLTDWIISVVNEGFLPKMALAIPNVETLITFFQKASQLKEVSKVFLGMGALGLVTRVLTKKVGSLWSYSSFSTEGKRLGQIDPVTLSSTYRYHFLDEQSEIYGIVGFPALHSKSPQLHNGGFTHWLLNKVYLPFETEELPEFFELAKALPLRGFSVTVPHKEKILPFLQRVENAVEEVGSCNTVVFEGNQWVGYNSDVEGFLAPLRSRLSLREGFSSNHLSQMRVALIGAGGVARAILYALKSLHCSVALFNRNEERAKELTVALGYGEAFPLQALASYQKESHQDFDLIVQATSLGMGEERNADPSEGYCFTGKEIAYEVIYTPEWTPFLLRAKAAGCETIGGYEMLKAQAKRQFYLFSGGKELVEGDEPLENS